MKSLTRLHRIKAQNFSGSGRRVQPQFPETAQPNSFRKNGIEPSGKKKTEFSTSADVLEELAEGNPVVRHILEYSTLEKLRSTYIEVASRCGQSAKQEESIAPSTNRSQPQGGFPAKIRISKISLSGRKKGMRSASCFKPEKRGWSFLGADYSQIELRLLAHFSEDPELLHAFKTGRDIHTHTASLVFGSPGKRGSSGNAPCRQNSQFRHRLRTRPFRPLPPARISP